jgi:hypothetical protein
VTATEYRTNRGHMFTKQKLDALFSYHAPNPQMTDKLVIVRAKARELAGLIVDSTDPGRDQDTAIEHLRTAVMFANASIVLNGE